MELTLKFNEGVNPPDNIRDVVLMSKATNTIFSGYYDLLGSKYISYDFGTKFRPEQVMWAEQPKNI